MTYVGYIAHQLPDRVRIRVEGKRGDRAFFARLVADLSAAPGVTRVRANPDAGSVAVSFDPRTGPIRSALEATGVFQFRAAPPPRAEPRRRQASVRAADPHEMLAAGLSGLGVIQLVNGEAVGPASENLFNAFRAHASLGNRPITLALTVLGLMQVARGQYLNSATSLFFYALTTMQMARERRAAAGSKPARVDAASSPPARRVSARPLAGLPAE